MRFTVEHQTICFFFLCTFDLTLWIYVFWNEFYIRKVIFIQLQEFPTPPYCCCCSVTKRSDSGIAEALKALKMHFWDPSQWDKMCFEYHRVIFHQRKNFLKDTLYWVHFLAPGQKWSDGSNMIKIWTCLWRTTIFVDVFGLKPFFIPVNESLDWKGLKVSEMWQSNSNLKADCIAHRI